MADTEVFTLAPGEWKLKLDGKVLKPTWNSKGAALAAIEVERRRAAKDSITTDRRTQLHRALDKVLDAKPLDYDAPQIAARRKKIRELEASGLAHDNPKIAKLREEIRKLQDGQSLS